MRRTCTLPLPRLGFNARVKPYTSFCGLCGSDVTVDPKGRQYLKEDGSAQVDAGMDQNHFPREENYHDKD